jgi:transposase InsO family protein
MSKAGCPYNNAPMELYYNTFKNELIKRFHFHTDKELNRAVSDYAYVWYNQIRPHSYNDYKTPDEMRFELNKFR